MCKLVRELRKDMACGEESHEKEQRIYLMLGRHILSRHPKMPTNRSLKS